MPTGGRQHVGRVIKLGGGDRDAIHYLVTVEDPPVYTRPWTMSWGICPWGGTGLRAPRRGLLEKEQDLPNILNAGDKQYYYGDTWRGR